MKPPRNQIKRKTSANGSVFSPSTAPTLLAADYKAAHKRYNQSEKGKARYRRYEANHPGHWRAKNAVSHAIRAGKLPRADSLLCMNCFEQAKDYHHPNYKPENWLKVFPVCKKCHRKLHKKSVPAPCADTKGENDVR